MIDYYEICSPLSADADHRMAPFLKLLSRELGEELRRVELADYLRMRLRFCTLPPAAARAVFSTV